MCCPQGDNLSPQPSVFLSSFADRYKWAAWDSRRGMSKADAQRAYLAELSKRQPDWQTLAGRTALSSVAAGASGETADPAAVCPAPAQAEASPGAAAGDADAAFDGSMPPLAPDGPSPTRAPLARRRGVIADSDSDADSGRSGRSKPSQDSPRRHDGNHDGAHGAKGATSDASASSRPAARSASRGEAAAPEHKAARPHQSLRQRVREAKRRASAQHLAASSPRGRTSSPAGSTGLAAAAESPAGAGAGAAAAAGLAASPAQVQVLERRLGHMAALLAEEAERVRALERAVALAGSSQTAWSAGLSLLPWSTAPTSQSDGQAAGAAGAVPGTPATRSRSEAARQSRGGVSPHSASAAGTTATPAGDASLSALVGGSPSRGGRAGQAAESGAGRTVGGNLDGGADDGASEALVSLCGQLEGAVVECQGSLRGQLGRVRRRLRTLEERLGLDLEEEEDADDDAEDEETAAAEEEESRLGALSGPGMDASSEDVGSGRGGAFQHGRGVDGVFVAGSAGAASSIVGSTEAVRRSTRSAGSGVQVRRGLSLLLQAAPPSLRPAVVWAWEVFAWLGSSWSRLALTCLVLWAIWSWLHQRASSAVRAGLALGKRRRPE